MRPLIALLLAVQVGCVHAIGVDPESVCAKDGKKLDTLTYGSGSEAGAVYINGNYVPVTNSTSSRSYTCVTPVTDQEKCKAKAADHIAHAAWDHDAKVFGRNMMLGAGYLFYLLPGAYLYYRFDSDREEVIDTAAQQYVDKLRECEKTLTH